MHGSTRLCGRLRVPLSPNAFLNEKKNKTHDNEANASRTLSARRRVSGQYARGVDEGLVHSCPHPHTSTFGVLIKRVCGGRCLAFLALRSCAPDLFSAAFSPLPSSSRPAVQGALSCAASELCDGTYLSLSPLRYCSTPLVSFFPAFDPTFLTLLSPTLHSDGPSAFLFRGFVCCSCAHPPPPPLNSLPTFTSRCIVDSLDHVFLV